MFRQRRFAEAGLAGALQDRVQANRYRKLEDRGEAHLIAWPVAQRRKDMPIGPCACWLGRWWSWGWVILVPRDGASGSKKRSPEERVVHPQGERRLRGPHGGSAGPVSPMTQSGRWSALTRPPPSCWPRPSRRCRPSRDTPCGRTTSTAEKAPAICSWL